jgi:anti-sigma factor RsiW
MTEAMERHVPEEEIALTLVGGMPPAEVSLIEAHLAACDRCAGVAASYRRILGALRVPQPSEETRRRVHERLRQRVRLRRFLDRLLTDPAWQVEVRRDPRSALERYQIEPTPQLVAALQEIGAAPGGDDGSHIDERVNKLWLGL